MSTPPPKLNIRPPPGDAAPPRGPSPGPGGSGAPPPSAVETMNIKIGPYPTTIWVSKAAGVIYAQVRVLEQCQDGQVYLGAKCVRTDSGEIHYVHPYSYVAVKRQSIAAVRRKKMSGALREGGSDNTYLEKALLWRLRSCRWFVNVLGYWQDKDYVYTVMEYLPNELIDVIANSPEARLPERQARNLFTQFMMGVKTLHDNRLCHRDLSSENVLVSEDGATMKLIDLGSCRPFEVDPSGNRKLFTGGSVFGKAQYMAPEYFSKQPYDGVKIDIWSCGVVLFTMVTGRMLYDTAPVGRRNGKVYDPVAAVIQDGKLGQWLNATFKDYSGGPLLSPPLVDLLFHMLMYDAKDRIANIGGMRSVLSHPWVTGEPFVPNPRIVGGSVGVGGGGGGGGK